jgi:hypothetical protein
MRVPPVSGFGVGNIVGEPLGPVGESLDGGAVVVDGGLHATARNIARATAFISHPRTKAFIRQVDIMCQDREIIDVVGEGGCVS